MAEGVREFEVGPDGEMSAEEHRRFIELLREGWEDVKAGRVVTSEELEFILE
jgi:predicted transcriptional regulator